MVVCTLYECARSSAMLSHTHTLTRVCVGVCRDRRDHVLCPPGNCEHEVGSRFRGNARGSVLQLGLGLCERQTDDAARGRPHDALLLS